MEIAIQMGELVTLRSLMYSILFEDTFCANLIQTASYYNLCVCTKLDPVEEINMSILIYHDHHVPVAIAAKVY